MPPRTEKIISCPDCVKDKFAPDLTPYAQKRAPDQPVLEIIDKPCSLHQIIRDSKTKNQPPDAPGSITIFSQSQHNKSQ